MVRQLGIPTLFFSLSSADTGWIPLLQCIGKVVDNVTYTDEFIKNEMTFEKNVNLFHHIQLLVVDISDIMYNNS